MVLIIGRNLWRWDAHVSSVCTVRSCTPKSWYRPCTSPSNGRSSTPFFTCQAFQLKLDFSNRNSKEWNWGKVYLNFIQDQFKQNLLFLTPLAHNKWPSVEKQVDNGGNYLNWERTNHITRNQLPEPSLWNFQHIFPSSYLKKVKRF